MAIKLSLVVSTPEVGAWPYGLLAGAFEEKMRKAAEYGYHGVELLFRDVDSLDKERVKRAIAEYGLAVPALVTGALYGLDKLCLLSPDAEISARAMKQLRGFVEFAGDYGAAVNIGLLRGFLRAMPERAGAETRLAELLHDAADYAAHCGSNITLEALNRYECDCVHNAQDGLEWVARVNHPHFGLLLDTFHMNIEDASIEGSIRDAGSHLWHVHIGDSNRRSAGQGHFDFTGLLRALRDIHYDGFLSAEHLALPDPDSAALTTARYMRSLV